MSNTSETGETAFAGVAAELHPLGATRSAMFGMPCLKIGTKAFAGLAAQAMVFKLPADARADALRLEGAHLFDPMGGRPMKEWVAVPGSHASHWSNLAASALAYVAGAPARRSRRSREGWGPPLRPRPACLPPAGRRAAGRWHSAAWPP